VNIHIEPYMAKREGCIPFITICLGSLISTFYLKPHFELHDQPRWIKFVVYMGTYLGIYFILSWAWSCRSKKLKDQKQDNDKS
jgi:hypothetical protein